MNTTTLLASLCITLGLGLITGAAIELLRVVQHVGDARGREWRRLRAVVIIAAVASLGTLPLVLLGRLSGDAAIVAVGVVILLGAAVVLAGVRASAHLVRDLLEDASASEPRVRDQPTSEDLNEDLEVSASAERSASMLSSLMNSESGVFQEPAALGPGRVLVVDDSAVNRAILRRHLMHLGHQATLCVDGSRALEMLDRDPHFDVVLLDLVMPGVGGLEVLQRIKSSERLREIPVLIISSVQDAEEVARCIEAGAADFLSKSIGPSYLSVIT